MLFFGAEFEDAGGFAGIEMRKDFFQQGEFGLGLGVASAGVFASLSLRFSSEDMSARINSVLITSMSRTGSIVPAT